MDEVKKINLMLRNSSIIKNACLFVYFWKQLLNSITVYVGLLIQS